MVDIQLDETGGLPSEVIDAATAVVTEDGGMTIDFAPDTPEPAAPGGFSDNLVNLLTGSERAKLAAEIIAITEDDERSRADWRESYARGLELLGLKYEERTQPWVGACGAFHPLMLESVIRFQSQAMTETFPATGPVKTQIVGRQTPEKDRQANRVKQDMNLFCCERMPEYREETEMMLFNLPLAGTVFRKFRYDRRYRRPGSEYVIPEHIVMPATATSILTSDFTHIMPRTTNQLKSDMATGLYIKVDVGQGVVRIEPIQEKRNEVDGVTRTARTEGHLHYLYERHCEYYFDWDPLNTGKFPLPYIVTVDKGSSKLLGIYRNWKQDDDTYERVQWVAQHKYMPGFGAYGIGLINILGGLTESATSILRQLVDGGTLSNLPAGFKNKAAKIKDATKGFRPGEFRDVELGTEALKESFFPLPFKEPSAVLQALLVNIIEEGRRIGSVADMKVADMSGQNMPVGTTIALLERSMKVMAAVQARLHNSFKTEFKILSEIIVDFMGEVPYDFELDERDQGATRAKDYGKPVDVIPVSDPNATTMAQRIMVMQAIQQLAQSKPEIYDMAEVHRMMISVLGETEHVDRFIPPREEVEPRDPITENMDILNGRPVRAGIAQDHESHIAVHMSAVEDPTLVKMLEGNPAAGQILAAAAAHIMEHVAFLYRAEIERELGVPLPPPGEPLPEDVEFELSRLVAAAGEKLLGRRQAEEEAKRIVEEMGDPMIQLQNRELDIAADKVRNVYITEMAKIQQARDEGRRKSAETEFKEQAETYRTLIATQVQTQEIASHEQLETAKTGAKLASDMGKTLVTAATSKAKIKADAQKARAKPKPTGAR